MNKRQLVGHVADGARHAGAGVDALGPQLELGMLGLVHLGAGFLVSEVLERRSVWELPFVVRLLDGLDFQTVCLLCASSAAADPTYIDTGTRLFTTTNSPT